jgi:hypothetical protein
MATRKFLTPGAALVVGLAAGLLAQQASATEELVVYGTAATVGVRAAPEAYRAEVASYMRSVSEQIKVTLDADLKRVPAPKVELASNEMLARG